VTVFVLDASAVLRFLDREAGADSVAQVFRSCAGQAGSMCISAVQWGEIAAVQRRRSGVQQQERVLDYLSQIDLHIIPVSAERAVRAASLRVNYKIAYADAFAAELTLDTPEHVLVTADYDFKAVENLIQIEFLPAK
jgi:predicted nucleic acid-binding protein